MEQAWWFLYHVSHIFPSVLHLICPTHHPICKYQLQCSPSSGSFMPWPCTNDLVPGNFQGGHCPLTSRRWWDLRSKDHAFPCDRISWSSPVWLQTCYVAEVDLDFLTLPPPPRYWDYRYTPPCQVSIAPRELDGQCRLPSFSTNWHQVSTNLLRLSLY